MPSGLRPRRRRPNMAGKARRLADIEKRSPLWSWCNNVPQDVGDVPEELAPPSRLLVLEVAVWGFRASIGKCVPLSRLLAW